MLIECLVGGVTEIEYGAQHPGMKFVDTGIQGSIPGAGRVGLGFRILHLGPCIGGDLIRDL